MAMAFMHGDHFDGALGHQLVHGKNQDELHPEPSAMIGYHDSPHHELVIKSYPHAEPPIMHGKYSHHHLPGYLHDEPHIGHPVPEPELYDHQIGHEIHPEPYHHLQLRFDPANLAVHGYDQLHDNHHVVQVQHAYPHPHPHNHPISLAEPYKHEEPDNSLAHYEPSFYGHRKPGDGFGPGGHYSTMPHQEIKYFPVPEPVPVYKPVPVEKPYPVPVDKPYPVKIDHPVPEPYVAKVVQPIIHKQAIIKSHVTHQTYDIAYPHHHHHASYKKA